LKFTHYKLSINNNTRQSKHSLVKTKSKMAITFSKKFMCDVRPKPREVIIKEQVDKIEKKFANLKDYKSIDGQPVKHTIDLWEVAFNCDDLNLINSLGIKSDVLKCVRNSFIEMGLTEIKITIEKQFPTYAEFAFVDEKDYKELYYDTSDNLVKCTKIFACF